MHSLSIVFGNGHAVIWTLMFRDEQKANAARNMVTASSTEGSKNINIVDDFGQQVSLRSEHVVGAMLEDLTLSKLCHVERAIHHAHIQAEAQTRAESDSKLRIASAMRGPSMISPMGANGMGR